ncbi:permease [Pseudaestuariivita atlantica]|uniref:Permease n=1 Tax=Pseudaestuariivita atlantica TaxID=1317121 RepID=A0A0L1JN74_9RHOB|nr:permease [Pseudaestuariivita atlantica]KNG93215.1 permease [Pseudaestuariivita atlantica]
MADSSLPAPRPSLWSRARKLDRVVLTILALLVAIALLDPAQFWPTVTFTAGALVNTAPFILFAILAVGYLKATGAETLIARSFEGRETQMIFMAAILGGLSPFCSCEIIPFIAALLAVGAPLSAVMALWLASPLMDPAMFAITAGTLGYEFALAKAVSAVSLGIAGGFVVKLFASGPVFADPLRAKPQISGCCSARKPFEGRPVWSFWTEEPRRTAFRDAVLENGAFLLKWLTVAYVIEALMLNYVPAEWIAQVLGGDGVVPILLGALVGAPAYLNGYAAVPLVDALLDQGMAQGAAMSFVIAGGVSCIPAAVAVWALVKPRVFAAYLGLGFTGAVLAGLGWAAIA